MAKLRDEADPEGLIFDAYRIEGIDLSQCRSIFFNWALNLPSSTTPVRAVNILLARNTDVPGYETHPMTQVLRAALENNASPARKGGRAGRTGV